jgi:hypothetical protein
MIGSTSKNQLDTLITDTKTIADQFWAGTIWGRAHLEQFLPGAITLSDSLKFKEDRYESIVRIRHIIENNRDELMREGGTLILNYLERYHVKSETADPFKLTFWFGVALGEKVGEVNGIDKRSVLLTTVEILDILCETHCGKKMPSDMRAKMDMSIAEGKHIDEYGQHGLYHSFKCISKIQ